MSIAQRVIVFSCTTCILTLSVVWITDVEGFWSWASALCALWFFMVWMSSLQFLVNVQLPDWCYITSGFEKTGTMKSLALSSFTSSSGAAPFMFSRLHIVILAGGNHFRSL
jgi:hypothetical protein